MNCFEWEFFEEFDNETLIGVNLTGREMALIRSAFSFVELADQWCDDFEYYSEVVPAIEELLYIVRL